MRRWGCRSVFFTRSSLTSFERCSCRTSNWSGITHLTPTCWCVSEMMLTVPTWSHSDRAAPTKLFAELQSAFEKEKLSFSQWHDGPQTQGENGLGSRGGVEKVVASALEASSRVVEILFHPNFLSSTA